MVVEGDVLPVDVPLVFTDTFERTECRVLATFFFFPSRSEGTCSRRETSGQIRNSSSCIFVRHHDTLARSSIPNKGD